MPYTYETHLHTCRASLCGKSEGSEHVRYYKELGYTGIFVTDHFFGGNTAVPRDLPWKERVDWFCSGYEEALIAGQKMGLDVFFAWEQNYEGDEYLIYGPDKEWLLEHPDIEHWSRTRQLEEVHKAGGAVIQAHPFRSRGYIKTILLGRGLCDGIEAVNTANLPFNDVYALRYAEEYGLVTTAGSDNHNSAARPKDNLSGVILNERLKGPKDYARIIREGGPIGLIIPEGWTDVYPADAPFLETCWIDESEGGCRHIPTGREWLHEVN